MGNVPSVPVPTTCTTTADRTNIAWRIDKKFGKGTAAELYKLSKRITQIDERHLEQLLAAAKMGFRVYEQLYNDLLKNRD